MVIEPTEAEISEAVALEAPVKSGVGPEVELVEALQPASTIASEQLIAIRNVGRGWMRCAMLISPGCC
jgi:hypothetical protein